MKSKLFTIATLMAFIFVVSCAGSPGVSPRGELPIPALPPVEMVWVSGGTFELGREVGTAGFGDAPPVSTVTLAGFYLGRFPITQTQFHAVMGRNPSAFTTANGFPPMSGEMEGNRPVESVSWYDAMVFSNRLSIINGLTPAYEMPSAADPNVWSTNPDAWGPIPSSTDPRWDSVRIVPGSTGYRLPTEAQWEFAAKGGVNGGNYTFAGSNIPSEVAWWLGNSGYTTRPVGLLRANALGLHDMSGNVWEHVWDWFGPYTAEPKTDPTGPSSGSARVVRSSAWANLLFGHRAIVRSLIAPAYRAHYYGFRVARP